MDKSVEKCGADTKESLGLEIDEKPHESDYFSKDNGSDCNASLASPDPTVGPLEVDALTSTVIPSGEPTHDKNIPSDKDEELFHSANERDGDSPLLIHSHWNGKLCLSNFQSTTLKLTKKEMTRHL